jgi:hypothetical protein
LRANTWWICATTAAPSPIAAPTRLVEAARTSPMANTPGMLVSSGSAARPAARLAKPFPVTTNPLPSTATQFASHSAFGSAPMNRKI